MVCVPCIVIPFCLWVFHRFIRPFLLKIWNPWGTKKTVLSTDKSSKESVVLKTKHENGEIKKTDKNNQNDLDESKKPLLSDDCSDPVINTKTLGDSSVHKLQESCVSDKKRD